MRAEAQRKGGSVCLGETREEKERLVKRITRFQDVPQFTPRPSYRVDVGWTHLEDWLAQDARFANLTPDFQRGRVWSTKQQIKYIEFILRGGDSARTIYWNCPGYQTCNPEELVLVDGLQRLTAVRAFLDNEIRVFGSLYRQYQDRIPPGSPARFRMHVNDLQTRAEVLTWYLEINDGGVVHSQKDLARVRRLLKEETGKSPPTSTGRSRKEQ
jgi:hypothetical protein